jgi:hypothetical protein
MALLAFTPAQDPTTELIELYDMGRITYDPTIVPTIDTERLYELSKFTLSFAEKKCVPPCDLSVSDLDLDINIVPYAAYEAYLLGVLDTLDPLTAAKIRGDEAFFDAFTFIGPDHPNPLIYFSNYPVDPLFIHELLHVLFPYADENTIRMRTSEVLASRMYKDWLRNNY